MGIHRKEMLIMIGFVLGGIAMAAVGLFLFLKPAVLWRITEQWKSNEADEPSRLYRVNTKFGGVILVLLGAVMIVFPFIPM